MTTSSTALASGGARAVLARRGAEARSWSVGGRDLLWPGDPAIWPQVSPILYPVVGWTREGARVAGRHYPLGLHGFAYQQDFEVEAAGADFARLTLRDNAATRALYPFAFGLGVEYRLSADALAIAIEVDNPGDEPAPYACGLHPGFRWPFAGGPREGARVVFESQEPAEVPVIAPGGLIGRQKRAIPLRGRALALSDELFAHDALCFLAPASRSLRFEEPGGAAIEMDFHGFDHAALWTRPGAPFLCLEAWTGYSDPEGFAGDLYEKPSMRMLKSGERTRHEASYRFFPAP
ncbi:MAG TPA: aldose 1-epimerase family protein [Roseiarcus sp.]|nr:aldose 1-epimerase family protein [Roseiarcus sp.]